MFKYIFSLINSSIQTREAEDNKNNHNIDTNKLVDRLNKIDSQIQNLNSKLENLTQFQKEIIAAINNQTMIYEEILWTLTSEQQPEIDVNFVVKPQTKKQILN